MFCLGDIGLMALGLLSLLRLRPTKTVRLFTRSVHASSLLWSFSGLRLMAYVLIICCAPGFTDALMSWFQPVKALLNSHIEPYGVP